MQVKQCADTLVVRLDPGEELVESLKQVAKDYSVKLATVTGLGAVNHLVIGLFDPKTKAYTQNILSLNLEIVSLTGNISTMQQETYLHLHMAAADVTGKVYGGHLNEALVSATAEIFINIIDGQIDREFHDKIGLNLMKF